MDVRFVRLRNRDVDLLALLDGRQNIEISLFPNYVSRDHNRFVCLRHDNEVVVFLQLEVVFLKDAFEQFDLMFFCRLAF